MEDKVFESIPMYFSGFDTDNINSICYIAAYSNLVITSIVLVIACVVTFLIYRDAGWLTRIAMLLIVIAQLSNLTLTLVVIYKGLNQLVFAIVSGAVIAVYFGLNEYVQWGYTYVYWVTS